MKIRIDYEMTSCAKLERTKAHAKEFKAMFTDKDLCALFIEALYAEFGDRVYQEMDLYGDILRCELTAFPGGTLETDTTHYRVEMILCGYDMTKISFYIDQNGTINLWAWNHFERKHMALYTVETFKSSGRFTEQKPA